MLPGGARLDLRRALWDLVPNSVAWDVRQHVAVASFGDKPVGLLLFLVGCDFFHLNDDPLASEDKFPVRRSSLTFRDQ